MQTRICPRCGAEYFAHVYECADCHETLKSPEELKQLDSRSEVSGEDAGGEMVVVGEGPPSWLKELHGVLLERGISSSINLSPRCRPGDCNSTSVLLVRGGDAERAESCIREHYRSTCPEASVAEEAGEENCPACGYHAGADARECPDCGLVLILEE